MPIRFKCPHCQKLLSAKDHMAGKRAACNACKKIVQIPTPAPVPPAAPAVDVEALAASALGEDAAPPPPEEPADKPITFTCDWCAEEVQVPATEAGKQIPCPHPDCRRIIKVPVPKREKKDWRTVDKKLPSLAKDNVPEKLEGVMGSPDDKGKVSQKALIEAGVVRLPPKKGIGVRGWVRRGTRTLLVAGVVLAVATVLLRLKKDAVNRKPPDLPTAEEITQAGYTSPVLLAEFPRANGLIKIRGGLAKDALRDLQSARGHIPRDVDEKKTPTIDRDLFLLDLALAQLELGGTEDEVRGKERLDWNTTVYKELEQTLTMIRAPEARAWAMRAVATKLLEKGKPELVPLAHGLALKLGLANAQPNAPEDGQKLALAVATDQKKLLEQMPKEPDPGKDIRDLVARVGYAEGYARKGEGAKALELAQAKGPPRDQLEAAVGAAAVILLSGKEKAAEEVRPLLDEALKRAQEAAALAGQKKGSPPPPWVILQLVRLAARVGGVPEDDLQKLRDGLPPEFRRRAALEVFLARCARENNEALRPPVDELGKDKDETTLGLAFEAAARQNAVFGQHEALDMTAESEYARFRPLVKVGLALGQRFGK